MDFCVVTTEEPRKPLKRLTIHALPRNPAEVTLSGMGGTASCRYLYTVKASPWVIQS